VGTATNGSGLDALVGDLDETVSIAMSVISRCFVCDGTSDDYIGICTPCYEKGLEQGVGWLERIDALNAEIARLRQELEDAKKRLSVATCEHCGKVFSFVQDEQGEWSRCLGCDLVARTAALERISSILDDPRDQTGPRMLGEIQWIVSDALGSGGGG
jgi:hypothetical protein